MWCGGGTKVTQSTSDLPHLPLFSFRQDVAKLINNLTILRKFYIAIVADIAAAQRRTLPD